LGGIANFLINKYWAFDDEAPLEIRQITLYAMVSVVTAAFVAVAVHILAVLIGLPYLLAKAIAAALVFLCWTYPAQSRLVFPSAGAAAPEPEPAEPYSDLELVIESLAPPSLARTSLAPTAKPPRAPEVRPAPPTTETPMPSDTPRAPTALSVIVPAYNEEERIAPTLLALDRYLAATSLDYEILVVDDGSTDGTVALVERLGAERPAIWCLPTRPNRGKGHAVRAGMLAARGRIRVMVDADGSIPETELPAVLAPLIAGEADIAIGSRYVRGARVAVRQPLWRRAWSRLVNRVVQRTLV